MEVVQLTIGEACEDLSPPMTEQQLRAIIRALRIRPCGSRRTGYAGHPEHTYDSAEIHRLHAAVAPWLTRTPIDVL